MAILASPYWETIFPDMHKLLAWIGGLAFATRFFLAGGTELALQIGHRRSGDLDYFSQTGEVHDYTREVLIHAFSG